MNEDLFSKIHRIGDDNDRTSQQDSPRDRSLAIKRRIAEIHAARGPAIKEAGRNFENKKSDLDSVAAGLKSLNVPLTVKEEEDRVHSLKRRVGKVPRELAKEERQLHQEYKDLAAQAEGQSAKKSLGEPPKKFRSASWDSIARKRDMVVEDTTNRTDIERQIEATKTLVDVVIVKKHQTVFEAVISDTDLDPFIANQHEIAKKLFGEIREGLSYAEKNLELTKNPKYEGIVFKTPYILKKNGDKLDRTEDQLKEDGIEFEKMVQEKHTELETRKAQAAEAVAVRLLDKASELFNENQDLRNSLKAQIANTESLNRNPDMRRSVADKNAEIVAQVEEIFDKIDGLENDFSAKIKEESRKIVEQW